MIALEIKRLRKLDYEAYTRLSEEVLRVYIQLIKL